MKLAAPLSNGRGPLGSPLLLAKALAASFPRKAEEMRMSVTHRAVNRAPPPDWMTAAWRERPARVENPRMLWLINSPLWPESELQVGDWVIYNKFDSFGWQYFTLADSTAAGRTVKCIGLKSGGRICYVMHCLPFLHDPGLFCDMRLLEQCDFRTTAQLLD